MILVQNLTFSHQHFLPSDLPFEPAFKTTALYTPTAICHHKGRHTELAHIGPSPHTCRGSHFCTKCPQHRLLALVKVHFHRRHPLRTGHSGVPVKACHTPSPQKERTFLTTPPFCSAAHVIVHLPYMHPNLASGGSEDEGTNSRGAHPGDNSSSTPNCVKGSLETQTCFNQLPQDACQAPHLYRLLL